MRIASVIIGFVFATLIEIGAYAEQPCLAAAAQSAAPAQAVMQGAR